MEINMYALYNKEKKRFAKKRVDFGQPFLL
ncbi:hypothetical protein [Salmonella phage SD-1_S14]|nr:hypothetical protein [Salmonella phage SD-1_S14]